MINDQLSVYLWEYHQSTFMLFCPCCIKKNWERARAVKPVHPLISPSPTYSCCPVHLTAAAQDEAGFSIVHPGREETILSQPKQDARVTGLVSHSQSLAQRNRTQSWVCSHFLAWWWQKLCQSIKSCVKEVKAEWPQT